MFLKEIKDIMIKFIV